MEWVPVAEGWGVGKEIEVVHALLLDAGVPAELSYRRRGSRSATRSLGRCGSIRSPSS